MNALRNAKESVKEIITALDALFAFLLFAFPFLHVNTGLDISDSTYNLLNFTTFPYMDRTWAVSTLLANVIGSALSKLPFGNTLLGMNIYCSILCGAFVAGIYFFLRKYYSAPFVFTGLLIAQGFSWCPRVILYHYLSYFLFVCGAAFLLTGIKTAKKRYYIIAGGVLALNVFVRFPNIVESALIIVLFAYGIMAKKNILKEFLCCFLSYLAVLFAGIAVISLFFGKSAYPDMIHSLFGMTKEATSYTPVSMIKTILGDYITYIKPLLFFLCAGVFGALFLSLLKKIWAKAIVILFMGIAFIAVMRILYYYAYFNFNFVDYRSIYMWGTLLLMTAIAVSLIVLFHHKASVERKLLALSVLFIIFITPIGSNNGLYTALNNLFLPATFTVGELTLGLDGELWNRIKKNEIKKLWWAGFSFRILGMMFAGMALLAGLAFGVVFVFRDASFIKGEFATVSDNPVVKGIRTSKDNAKDLQEVNDYLNLHNLKQKQAVAFGFIPGVYYVFEEECALSHSWADLDSYPTEDLKKDLDRLAAAKETPVFFYAASFADLTVCDTDTLENKKQKMFARFLQDGKYTEVLRNDRFVICLPKQEQD